jgi:hypothetical protein
VGGFSLLAWVEKEYQIFEIFVFSPRIFQVRVYRKAQAGIPSRAHGIPANTSGVYICKSVVNDVRHGNFICKS